VIGSLAGDPEQARAMGLRGPAYLEQHFNRSVLAEKLAGILEDMTGQ
jgi:hypothetical protein